ncbi:MAG TPA: VIT domain-containing protein, partial [Sunxiuqinia sp.]|nr:VIT domain-containing protein [Sunxiuqinia sp.]
PTLFFLLIANLGFGQYLRVNNPQSWGSGQGTIEKTKITYEPQGLYMKVEWELTFSAKGNNFIADTDTLEVVYDFKLPQGSSVIDSWLWYGDTILPALIIDRWSASQVYENIVGRRRDPSILTKNGNGYYQLKVYPMAARESRKVKITFLEPTNWTKKSVVSQFLAEDLLVSKNPINSIQVEAKLGAEWKNPHLIGAIDYPLSSTEMDGEKTVYSLNLNYNKLSNNQKFEVSNPMQNGYYLGYFENNGEKFYQLALDPSEGMDIKKPQKLLFLIDYQKGNSDMTQADLLNQLADYLKTNLTEKDSFNILYYDLNLQKVKEGWIPGDSESVSAAIGDLGNEPFVSYSNLASLLASGIEEAQKETGSKIVLISNSDHLGDAESANPLIDDLMALMNPVHPIYIADFQTKDYNYYYFNGYTYKGNEYFYTNLAKLTGGDYFNLYSGDSFYGCFNKTFQAATSEKGLIDIHTKLQDGLCYGRYTLSEGSESNINTIFLQVGKYSGNFPFEVEVSGSYGGELFSNNLEITKDNAIASDSVLSQFWFGNEITKAENSANYSYTKIKDVIDISIRNRVLSQYTAFLSLEPSQLGELEKVENESGQIIYYWSPIADGGMEIPVNVEQEQVQQPKIKLYPNPFYNQVTIQVQLPKDVQAEDVHLEIYDLFGKLVKRFDAKSFNGKTDFNLEWDGTGSNSNRLPDGTYLFVCTTPKGKVTKKLILQH